MTKAEQLIEGAINEVDKHLAALQRELGPAFRVRDVRQGIQIHLRDQVGQYPAVEWWFGPVYYFPTHHDVGKMGTRIGYVNPNWPPRRFATTLTRLADNAIPEEPPRL